MSDQELIDCSVLWRRQFDWIEGRLVGMYELVDFSLAVNDE